MSLAVLKSCMSMPAVLALECGRRMETCAVLTTSEHLRMLHSTSTSPQSELDCVPFHPALDCAPRCCSLLSGSLPRLNDRAPEIRSRLDADYDVWSWSKSYEHGWLDLAALTSYPATCSLC